MNSLNLSVLVPGAVPVDSILGSSYEQQISLSWREPLQTYGLIRKYEVNTQNQVTQCRQVIFRLRFNTSGMEVTWCANKEKTQMKR